MVVDMNKETASQWYEAYRILQQKKQQEQAEFNAVGLNLAKEQIKRNSMSFREMQAWAAFCEALPREQKQVEKQKHLRMSDIMFS
jgi:hypothetical protein